MKRFLTLLLMLLIFNTACDFEPEGEQSYDDSDFGTFERYEAPEEELASEIERLQEKREDRNQEGDTIALKDKKLQEFLPKEIEDYEPSGDFVGNPYGVSGASYSNAEQDYSDGENHLRISLVDYNAENSRHTESIAMWKSGLRINNYREEGGSFMLNGMIGWEVYHKKDRRAEIMLAVSDRILLTILADHQKNNDFVKEVAQSMKLKTLARY